MPALIGLSTFVTFQLPYYTLHVNSFYFSLLGHFLLKTFSPKYGKRLLLLDEDNIIDALLSGRMLLVFFPYQLPVKLTTAKRIAIVHARG